MCTTVPALVLRCNYTDTVHRRWVWADTGAVTRRLKYNDNPSLTVVPLSVEEATSIAEEPKQIRSSEQVTHFAWRAAATAAQLRQARVEFDNELRRRSAAIPRSGLQPTLSPEQAARFLSPEQLTKLFDKFSQERLSTLEALKEQAEEAMGRQEVLVADLRDAVARVAVDPATDPALRLELQNAFAALDQKPGGLG